MSGRAKLIAAAAIIAYLLLLFLYIEPVLFDLGLEKCK